MKKKVLAAVFFICVVYLVGSTIYEKITYTELSFEEKVLEVMNYDEMAGTKNVDSIVFITEADDGYFCVATASADETVHFGYIRDEKGELEFAGKSFLSLPMIVYNEDPTAFQRTSILNFSDKDFYYGCYQRNDDIQISVNGAEVEKHSFTLSYSGEDFDMDFWLVCTEGEPTVMVEEVRND